MKKVFALLFSFFLTSVTIQAQTTPKVDEFSGYWKGNLEATGFTLTVIFYINPPQTIGDIKVYKSTLDVPMQSLKNYKIDETIIKNKEIQWILSSLNADFKGKLQASGLIEGNWKQNGKTFPLKLSHSETLTSNKPQTPKNIGDAYTIKLVDFSHPSGKLKFGGTLTIPKKVESQLTSRTTSDSTPQNAIQTIDKQNNLKYPAILLISGSGSQDRDETIGDHKPFAVWADNLSKNNFVVLRVDDRGVGFSIGDPEFIKHSTTESLVVDANAAVEFLKHQPIVDSTRIFLIGHSEGANIAIKLANQRNDIAGVISLAGMTTTGIETSVFQNAQLWAKSGYDSSEIAAASKLHRLLIKLAFETADPDSSDANARYNEKIEIAIKAQSKFVKKAYKKQIVFFNNQAKSMGAGSGESLLANTYLNLMTNDWINYYLSYDPRPEFLLLPCDLFMIQGGNDNQINPLDTRNLVDQLQKEKSNITYKEFPILNHLLQHSQTGDISEYFTLDETVALEAMLMVNLWLNDRVKTQ